MIYETGPEMTACSLCPSTFDIGLGRQRLVLYAAYGKGLAFWYATWAV